MAVFFINLWNYSAGAGHHTRRCEIISGCATGLDLATGKKTKALAAPLLRPLPRAPPGWCWRACGARALATGAGPAAPGKAPPSPPLPAPVRRLKLALTQYPREALVSVIALDMLSIYGAYSAITLAGLSFSSEVRWGGGAAGHAGVSPPRRPRSLPWPLR